MNIMIKAFALLVTLMALVLTSACGANAAPATDSTAKPYVDRFYAEAKARQASPTPNVVVVVGDLSDRVKPGYRTLGVCAGGVVTLDEKFWSNLSTTDADREALVFHELGHCALHLEHVEGDTTAFNPATSTYVRVPTSLMRAEFIGGYAFELAREHYLSQLFK